MARLRAAGCVFAEDEARLLLDAATSPAHLDALVGRRVAGEPLEWLLGWAEVGGVRVALATGVFVPRARSALVVREAVALARAADPQGVVLLDLCCGSGYLGLAVALALRKRSVTQSLRPAHVELHAADVDRAAVDCARGNLAPVGGSAWLGDLFAAVPPDLAGRVDVLLCNAPYVPTAAIAAMPPEARWHEPRAALDGGDDGLDVHRRVAAQAARWLAPGGHLVIETGRSQAAGACDLFAACGLVPRVVHDEGLAATVVVGALRSSGPSGPSSRA